MSNSHWNPIPHWNPIRAAALALALAPGVALATDFEQSVAAEPGGRLEVRLTGGSLVIETHDRDEVRVEALAAGMGRGNLDIELQSDGQHVVLRGDTTGWLSGLVGAPRVRIRLRIPSEFSIEVHSSGGGIELEDLEGEVLLRTSGGTIDVGSVEGDLDLETSGGAIEVREIEGQLRARTSGGPIRVFGVSGETQVRTSGGPITVLDAEDHVEARTSGGPVTVRFLEAPRGSLETSGGNIEVEFPDGEGFRLDARTSGGRVQVDPAIRIRGNVKPSQVDAELNDGGDTLQLRTSGGNIVVRMR